MPFTRALRIVKVQDFHAGTYRCKATKIIGGRCIYYSDNATLTVKGIRKHSTDSNAWHACCECKLIELITPNKIPFPRTHTVPYRVTKAINERTTYVSFLAIIIIIMSDTKHPFSLSSSHTVCEILTIHNNF